VVRLPDHSEGGWVSFHLTPHPQQSRCFPFGGPADGCGWVEHNDQFKQTQGLARCWVLRGHPVNGFFSGCSWFWLSNACCVRVVAAVGDWGVVVC
jgi:hypothetical protein